MTKMDKPDVPQPEPRSLRDGLGGNAWQIVIGALLAVFGILLVVFVGLMLTDMQQQSRLASPRTLPPPEPTRNSPPDALAAGRTFSGSNADWKAQYPDGLQHAFEDGVPMVLVPAGCLMMGMTDAGIDDLIRQYPNLSDFYRASRPQHEQCFGAPFWIDRTEVTQADFMRLGGRKSRYNEFAGDQRPVDSITWFEARDFCALRGARLPTEAEWEYAARGPDSLAYPWGNAWDEDNAVSERSSTQGSAPVGSRPAGRSWVGADDMSGNVWEWTRSQFEQYPYAAGDGREEDTGMWMATRRVLRGGSWRLNGPDVLRAGVRTWSSSVNWRISIGFRCASSP